MCDKSEKKTKSVMLTNSISLNIKCNTIGITPNIPKKFVGYMGYDGFLKKELKK